MTTNYPLALYRSKLPTPLAVKPSERPVILSLGAGVQSSTILMMAVRGELHLDGAVFADTGFEPQAVYRHLEWLYREATEANIPMWVVRHGNIYENELSDTKQVGENGKYTLMPYFTMSATGKLGRLRRQCTSRYKIEPIQKWLRNRGASATRPVDLAIGISIDEIQRMKDSRVQFARHVFPLIERRMSRQDCLAWMSKHRYPEPPKSACVHCPFRSDDGWRKMQRESPDEFELAVQYDATIRDHYQAFKDAPYIHDSRRPLGEIDFRTSEERTGMTQLDMFDSDGCGMLCAADEDDALGANSDPA